MGKNDLISELLNRGVREVIVYKELEQKLRDGKRLTVYLGIDPTGSRLHLGHAIALRKLRDFQQMGHRVIFLIGNFTALIGDTSDKDALRPPMTPAQIEENFKTYKEQASRILDFSKIELRYNADWLSKLKLKDILELANKFTVQQMIGRDMYQKRLEQAKPIGLHEFLYPLMQGYDSVAMDVDLEIGGNDQLFNMLAGRLLQKIMRNRDKHVMTTKLLEGPDSRKMSKTYNNTINITDEPADQYGKIMSIKDELIMPYFELCTDVKTDEIHEIGLQLQQGTNPRDAKMKLAREIVTLYNSEEQANKAEKEFVKIFQKKELPDDIYEVTFPKRKYELYKYLQVVGFAKSNSEGRRLIKEGGVTINNQRISDPDFIISFTKPVIIKVGKRRFVKVRYYNPLDKK